jgi:DNA polymerase elongation subunit (family B)
LYGALSYNRFTSTIKFTHYTSGKRELETRKWVPDFYVPVATGKEDSGFTSIDGKPLQRVESKTWGDRKKRLETYEAMGIQTYGADLPPENKFVLETWPGTIQQTVPDINYVFLDIETECENGFPDKDKATEKINLITIYSSERKKFFTWGLEIYGTKYKNTIEDVEYFGFDNEEKMLKNFVVFLQDLKADVWSGWNSSGFDVPFIYNRIERVCGEDYLKRLSPFGEASKRLSKKKDLLSKQMKDVMEYNISGITDYDYLELYKKYEQGKKENYKLDTIAEIEKVGNKLPLPPSCSNIKEFYHKEWQKFVEYNIHDVRIILKLDRKLAYMRQSFTLSYQCHCQLGDVFGTVAKFDTAVYNFLFNKNVILASDTDREARTSQHNDQFEGAFVKEPIPGMYEWVIDMDVSSLYPTVVMMQNISPETKLYQCAFKGSIWNANDDRVIVLTGPKKKEERMTAGGLKKKIRENGWHISAHNTIFENKTKRWGTIPQIFTSWYKGRKECRKIMEENAKKAKAVEVSGSRQPGEGLTEVDAVINDQKVKVYLTKQQLIDRTEAHRLEGVYFNLQLANKILMNSAYGALSTKYSRFFDTDLSLSITLSGQKVTTESNAMIENYFCGDAFVTSKIARDNFKIDMNKTVGSVGVYNDTDSIYITFKELLDKLGVEEDFNKRLKVVRFLTKVTQKRLAEFNDKQSAEFFNCENMISFSSELIADTAIFCAKKKYCAHQVERDGIPCDKFLIKGLDVVKSICPKKCKKKIEEVMQLILRKGTFEKVTQITKDFYKEFMTWDLENMALPKSCNNMEKFACNELEFIPKTPQHMKAAIVYNYFLEQNNLIDYEPIMDGDKFYMFLLKKNLQKRYECIGYKTALPKEISVTEDMLDKRKHFELAYVSPLEPLFVALKWQMEDFGNEREKVGDLFD